MPDVAGVKFPYTPQGVQQAEQFASSLAQQYGTPANQMGLGAPGYWRGGPFEMAPRMFLGGPPDEALLDMSGSLNLNSPMTDAELGIQPLPGPAATEQKQETERLLGSSTEQNETFTAEAPGKATGSVPESAADRIVKENQAKAAEAAAKKAKRREEWRGVGLDVAKDVGTTAVTSLLDKKKSGAAWPAPPAGTLSAGKGLDLNTLLPPGSSLGALPGYGMAEGGPPPIPDMMSLPPFMAPLGGGGGGPPPPGPPPGMMGPPPPGPPPPPPTMQMGGVLGRKMFADDGGALRGPGGPKQDLIPVWASNGEYMLSKDTVDRVGGGDHQRGVASLNRLNFGRK